MERCADSRPMLQWLLCRSAGCTQSSKSSQDPLPLVPTHPKRFIGGNAGASTPPCFLCLSTCDIAKHAAACMSVTALSIPFQADAHLRQSRSRRASLSCFPGCSHSLTRARAKLRPCPKQPPPAFNRRHAPLGSEFRDVRRDALIGVASRGSCGPSGRKGTLRPSWSCTARWSSSGGKRGNQQRGPPAPSLLDGTKMHLVGSVEAQISASVR